MYEPTHDNNERTIPRGGTQASPTYVEPQRYLSLRDILQILWRRLWILVLVPLVLGGTAVGVSLSQTPVYEASATVLVGSGQGLDAQSNLSNTITGLQVLTHEIAARGLPPSVAEEVIQRAGQQGITSQDLRQNLTIEQVADTRLLQFSYRDTEAESAQETVNHVADVYAKRIPEMSEIGPKITARVGNYATTPNAPVAPDPLRNGLLALAMGLMLGIGLTFLLEYLDDSWRSPEELEQFSGVPTFGIIPEFVVAKNGKRRKGY
jgi:capsular polysaccharide biosynthesis protein